ncbi:hypothetical protein [Mycolicibacterium fortuitum]|uniref:hypothetical protein n=1 Tax=Paenibacillus sp. FSL W8-1287 TaxID=2954653 RepID=UPI001CE1DE90|nr:hypothetical protein [Mycolicibacterium fortuitum]
MARGTKITAEKADEVKVGEEVLVIWKANRPLSITEHEQLSEKIRFESDRSGARIVLAPFSVEVAVDVQNTVKNAPEGAQKATEDKPTSEDSVPPAGSPETSDSNPPTGDVTGDK